MNCTTSQMYAQVHPIEDELLNQSYVACSLYKKRLYTLTHIFIINTLTQSSRSTKRRKLSIHILWTKADIDSILKQPQHGVKNQPMAISKQFPPPFQRLSIDDICSCLKLHKHNRTWTGLSLSFDVPFDDAQHENVQKVLV